MTRCLQFAVLWLGKKDTTPALQPAYLQRPAGPQGPQPALVLRPSMRPRSSPSLPCCWACSTRACLSLRAVAARS